MFDLDSISPKETLQVDLVHPGSLKPLGAFVTLSGLAHEATAEARRIVMDSFAASIKLPAKPRKKFAPREQADPTIQINAGEVEESTILALATRTLGWEGIMKNGEPVPFSFERAKELYSSPVTRWIRDQVEEALKEDEAFFD